MMAKEVKKLNHDPLQDDSSLFNVDFASEGLSWVKGFYQKLETSCNVYVDTCNKYVNTAGEHIKRIYDEVCEWEKPCDVEGLVSDLCLNRNSTTEDSNESLVKLQKNSSEEKLSDCKQIQPTALTLPEDSSLLPLASKCKEEPVSIEENCLESTGSGESIQLPTEVNDMFQETITLSESSRCENKSQIGSHKLVTLQFQDNGADFDVVADGREDFTSSTFNVLSNNLKTELEAIEIDDSWFDVERSEIALNSRRVGKNMSFKKNLRNVFMPQKVHNLAYDGSTSEMQNKDTSSDSSVVPTSGDFYLNESTQDSLESEWELL